MGKKKGEVSNVKLAGNIEARVEVQPTPGEESPAADLDMIQGYMEVLKHMKPIPWIIRSITRNTHVQLYYVIVITCPRS